MFHSVVVNFLNFLPKKGVEVLSRFKAEINMFLQNWENEWIMEFEIENGTKAKFHHDLIECHSKCERSESVSILYILIITLCKKMCYNF